jgi:hypothetical protein
LKVFIKNTLREDADVGDYPILELSIGAVYLFDAGSCTK